MALGATDDGGIRVPESQVGITRDKFSNSRKIVAATLEHKRTRFDIGEKRRHSGGTKLSIEKVSQFAEYGGGQKKIGPGSESISATAA